MSWDNRSHFNRVTLFTSNGQILFPRKNLSVSQDFFLAEFDCSGRSNFSHVCQDGESPDVFHDAHPDADVSDSLSHRSPNLKLYSEKLDMLN